MVERLLQRERRFLLGLLFVSGLLVLWVTRAYLAWAVLGLILAYVTFPIQTRLARAFGGRETLAAITIVTGTLLAVAVPIVLLLWSMAGDLATLTASLSGGGLHDTLSGIFGRFMAADRADELAASAAERVGAFAVEAAPEIALELVDATVGIFVLVTAHFAVLVNRNALYGWIRRVLPLQDDREEELLGEVGRAVDAVVFGIIVVAILTAVAGGLLWWIGGLPSPIFWTFVIFLFSMVPALGPSLVLYPGALYAWLSGNDVGALVLLVGGSLLILAVDVWIRPSLIAKKGGLDGTLALLSVMGGIVAMGPIGIFAGPLIMAVFLKVMHLTLETHSLAGEGFTNLPKSSRDRAPPAGPPPET